MKYLILIAIVYGIYRVSQVAKLMEAKRNRELNQEKDEDFTDYEELD